MNIFLPTTLSLIIKIYFFFLHFLTFKIIFTGTFAIDGFLIRQNGIQEAPGSYNASPGFGRRQQPGASKTNEGGGSGEGKSGESITGNGANAEDELLRLCVLVRKKVKKSEKV